MLGLSPRSDGNFVKAGGLRGYQDKSDLVIGDSGIPDKKAVSVGRILCGEWVKYLRHEGWREIRRTCDSPDTRYPSFPRFVFGEPFTEQGFWNR